MACFLLFPLVSFPAELMATQFFSGLFLFSFNNLFFGMEGVFKILISLVLLSLIGVLVSFLFSSKEKKRSGISGVTSQSQASTSSSKIQDIDESNNKIKEQEEQIKDLKSKIESLQVEIAKLNDKNIKLRKRIDDLEKNSSNESQTGTANKRIDVSDPGKKESNNYVCLTVIEGPLVEAGPEHVVYYKAWKNKGKIYFEFVNNDRTKKAINNRSSIIDPFCEKVGSSKSPDDSEIVSTITPGLLNDDYSVLEKAKIEYK